jgi:hypothetical protein
MALTRGGVGDPQMLSLNRLWLSLDRAGSTQGGEGRFTMEPVRVVADRHQKRPASLSADSGKSYQTRCSCGDQEL